MQRITAIVVVLVALLGYTIATEEQAPKWTPPSPATNPNVVFVETFDNTWNDRWTISKDPKFTGKWEVRQGDAPYGVAGSEGLVVSTPAAHHGIVTKFPKVLHNENKDLVVQFEFRSQKFLDCGGGYIKLLRADSVPENLESFAADTPYTIMFGPDKCGSTNKVHFIFNHQSPVTKNFEEKHFIDAPQWKNDKMTHLYTLEVRKDNTVFLYLDQELVKNGTLLSSFKPAVNPAKEIDDPTDSKPADWVDEETIADPEAKKPDDWDEDAPAEIADPNDKKPEGWLDNEPAEIPDPEAQKPADWSDEEDGEWEAVTVPNPKCEAVGCGEWKPARIANPAYKGKWIAPRIPNPAYKGPWKARQIPNPEFFEDLHPHNFLDIGGLGIELWTVTEGQMFSNIIITHDKAIADEFAEHTFVPRHQQELKIQEEENAKNQPSAVTEALAWVTRTLESLQHNPLALGGVGVALGIIPVILYFACRSSKSDAPTGERIGEKKEEKDDKKDESKDKKEDEKEVKEEKKTPAKSGTRRRLDN